MKIAKSQANYTGSDRCAMCGRSDKIVRLDYKTLKCSCCKYEWRSFEK